MVSRASTSEPGVPELKIGFIPKLLNCLGIIFLSCTLGLKQQCLSLRGTVMSVLVIDTRLVERHQDYRNGQITLVLSLLLLLSTVSCPSGATKRGSWMKISVDCCMDVSIFSTNRLH